MILEFLNIFVVEIVKIKTGSADVKFKTLHIV